MTPHRGNTILCSSSQQLPRTLEGLFELTRGPSRALNLYGVESTLRVKKIRNFGHPSR